MVGTRQSLGDQRVADVLALDFQHAAGAAVIAVRRTSRPARAGARHQAQIQLAMLGQLTQPRGSAIRKRALAFAARMIADLRGVQTDQTDGPAAGPDGVAVEDIHGAYVQRLTLINEVFRDQCRQEDQEQNQGDSPHLRKASSGSGRYDGAGR